MPRYLIEIPHGDELLACQKALRAIEEFGSHFVTRADWGCENGTHAGWLIAELEDRKQALQVVPPEFRSDARIVELNSFSRDQIKTMISEMES